MVSYYELNAEGRRKEYEALAKKYSEFCARGLSLDLSRGKPNAAQLDVSVGLLTIDLDDYTTESGFDCRNYGLVDGLPESKRFFSEAFGLPEDYIIVGGNSSLQLMYDALARAMIFGVKDSPRPWGKEDKIKWICITPGYDRHFKITEALGFELLSVPMLKDGPDMDMIEELVKDPSVKGIWCVPKYSNPTGNTYSDEVVRRFASMKCAAPDFRIMWDNAYAVHDFGDEKDNLADIFAYAREYGTEDRIFYFSSTSKITFPGAGVAIVAMNENNRKQVLPLLGTQTIGYDKLNQLRHLKYFGSVKAMLDHMDKLGRLIGKKFEITLRGLECLRGLGIAEWTEPNGGYFVSLDVLPGTAKRVFALMKQVGVTLTSVGATFPYGIDPKDTNLRLAPTYPADSDLALAVEILTVAVRMAALEKLGL